MNDGNKKLTKIKTGVLNRGLSLAKLTFSTGSNAATFKLIQSIKPKDPQSDVQWKLFLNKQLKSLSTELGNLKGSLMKAGQMLSMYGEHFFPPEANQFLKTLQMQSTPLEFSVIEKQLQNELPSNLIKTLQIDPEAIGTASLGQVHKAKMLHSNQVIALKIQYPGVKNAIDSDLKALKTLLKILKWLPKELNTDPLFSEVKNMLIQETDYVQEAQATLEYRQKLSGISDYIVPQVFSEYSTDKIIATSYEKGLKPDDNLVRQLPQNRKNKIGHIYLDLYFKELFLWGIVQTDPHLGNYKIRLNPAGDDQLILLDFGATRKYPDNFLKNYKKLILSSLDKRRADLIQAALELKFLDKNDPPDLVDLFVNFCELTVEPFSGGEYDFKNSDLPQRLAQIVFKIIQDFPLRSPPQEVIFLDRKTSGVFTFLKVIEAKLDASGLLRSYLA